MIKTMNAKYAGKCSVSGASINVGDSVKYDSVSRKVWLHEPGDMSNPYGGISQVTLQAYKYVAPFRGVCGAFNRG